MKATLVFVLATVCLFALYNQTYGLPADEGKPSKEGKEPKDIKDSATASKDVKDAIKAAKDAKKTKKECEKPCDTQYDPVCAHDPSDSSFKPRTFGSQCALDVHNCVSGTRLAVKSKGECPGSGGVRLS